MEEMVRMMILKSSHKDRSRRYLRSILSRSSIFSIVSVYPLYKVAGEKSPGRSW